MSESAAQPHEVILIGRPASPITGFTYRDWISESITLKKGLTGVKPEKVCHWLFEVMGCEPPDELHDLFPGTGAVSKAWESWRTQLRLAV